MAHKQQHHPVDKKSFEKGINSDVNKEILSSRQGEHVDAKNMRSISMDGNNLAKKKVKGEELLFENIDNRCLNGTGQPLSSDYECMMTQEINSRIVEIWASPNEGEFSLIRVDGKIVAMSEDFPVTLENPLQYHKNENCIGGEFYITDNNVSPMVFNLADLMLNSGMTVGSQVGTCTDKYFDAFNLDKYTVNVNANLYKISFIKQQNNTSGSFDVVFGSAGVAVGYHSYTYRFATQDGDRTGWAPITERIPVVQRTSSPPIEQPNVGNISKDPDVSVPSVYGNHLRIKYDNLVGFSFIEVRRDSWVAGSQLGSQPVSEIIGSLPVQDGLNIVNVLDYTAPDEVQEPVDISEISESPTNIQSAKSIRYFDSKLWLFNVKYNSRDLDENIELVDEDEPVFSTIEKMGKRGHSDVYNATYYKSNMRGENAGIGVVVFDDSGAKTFAKDIVQNFNFPNRRDPVSNETLGTSYKGLPVAADTNGEISRTHEVFDHYDNIGRDGEIDINVLASEVFDAETGPYKTFRPTSQNENSSTYGDRINNYVATRSNQNDITGIPRFVFDYNPKAFGLDYYSQGFAFKGIDDSKLPSWADGFSVVQTASAGRVAAQGLAYYDMEQAEGALGAGGGKKTFSVVVHFPDLDGDIGLTPEILDDLLVNTGPGSPYRIQAVSPLGFFTDVHSFFRQTGGLKARGTDMITYCRVLYDRGLINPVGIIPNAGWGVGGDGYTSFGTWRETSSNSTSFVPNGATGRGTNFNLFTIDSAQIESTQTGVGTNVRLTFTKPIYSKQACSADNQDYYRADVKEWQEPIYVVNLVKDEAQINPGVINTYQYTGNYIKLRSKLLISDGSATQNAVLVSERWEDCIQTISGQVFNDYSSLERFLWVVDEDDNSLRWLNVSNKTSGEISVINADIIANGFHTVTDSSGSYDIYGTYTSSQTSDGTSPIFNISIDGVPQGRSVEVRYDNRIPIRVFGGDTFINEHVWAVHDNRYDKGAKHEDNNPFKFNVPFPFPAYGIPDGLKIIRQSDLGFGGAVLGFTRYQQPDNITGLHEFRFDIGTFGVGSGTNPAEIRQLITQWTAETRVNLSFMFNDESNLALYGSQTFPLKNYVPRPYKWETGDDDDPDDWIDKNNLFDNYYEDYGTEWDNWGLGGFRYKPQVNTDYSQTQTTEVITTVPSVGFTDQTEYCTRAIWSVRRPINIQDSPTVKTFLPGNLHDISDDTGEIKFAWSADSDKGNNLYNFTDSGVCLLLVNKNIINQANGGELSTVGLQEDGVVNDLWIDKSIGMSDETWRSWAEYSNMIMWSNNVSSYSLIGNSIKDNAETGYKDLYVSQFVPNIGKGYSSKMSGVYDILRKEYYSTADSGEDFSTLIFGTMQDALQCQSDYRYDKFLSFNNNVYGMKNMETYELGVGNLIDGEEYECYVSGVSDADVFSDKEFIRIRVNSNTKPKRIEFFDDYEQYKSGTPSSIVDAVANPISIKDYNGFECYIPRKDLPPNLRQQGRKMIFRIVSDDNEDFMISTVGVQYKILK